LPAKPYAATVALLADGNIGFGTWPRDLETIPDDVLEFRQNMTPLIDGGVHNPWRRSFWGGTTPGQTDPHTARSPSGMTREGYVGYLWGDALTPHTLSDALLAARCEYAIHLDMNGSNTGFELYRVEHTADVPRLGRSLVSGYETEGTIGGLPGMTFR